jgi:formate hydrogenlyase subunit 3/multisubunit Na+/H+ antiporter MnhD subunit
MNQAILLLLFPAAAALIMPLGGVVWPRFGRMLSILSYLAGLAYGALLFPAVFTKPESIVIGNWPPPFGINLFVSPLSLGLVLLVYLAAALLLIFGDGERKAQFYLLYSLLVMSAVGLILTADLFNVFVFLEIASISTFALIAAGRPESAPAGSLRYLVLAQLTALLMLAGIALVYSATGVLNIASLSSFATLNPAFAFLVGLLILLPILLELKSFPFNGWVGGVYRGATPVVGATMSGLTTIAVVMLLSRFLLTMMNGSSAFSDAQEKLRIVVLALGALTVIIAESAAFRERELKRVLGYSSAGQMGLIAVGVAIATQNAREGVLFLLVSHTLAKILLFIVGSVSAKLGGTDRWQEMRGIARRYPLLGILFAIGAMTLMGIPLFSGFWGKLDLIRAAVAAGGIYLVGLVALLAATVIEGVYFMKIAHALFEEPAEAASEGAHGQVSRQGSSAPGAAATPYRAGFLFPAVLLAAGIIVLGILPGLIQPWLTAGAAELLHPASGYAAHILASGGAQ